MTSSWSFILQLYLIPFECCRCKLSSISLCCMDQVMSTIEIFFVPWAFERIFDCITIKWSVKLLNLFDTNTKELERERDCKWTFLIGKFRHACHSSAYKVQVKSSRTDGRTDIFEWTDRYFMVMIPWKEILSSPPTLWWTKFQ